MIYRYRYLEQMDVWGPTLSEMMDGVKVAEDVGWFQIGTPNPMFLPGQPEFGMMQKMYRHKESSGV
jgi:hypothetical protein